MEDVIKIVVTRFGHYFLTLMLLEPIPFSSQKSGPVE